MAKDHWEVLEPIINSPFEEPARHWLIVEGEPAELRDGRRPSAYYYRDPKQPLTKQEVGPGGIPIEMQLVNRVRARIKAWRREGYPGVTRTTLELLQWWTRDGRENRLFFAQLEAVETIIFLTESRLDFRQGIEIPRDEPSDDRKAEGYGGFASRSM